MNTNEVILGILTLSGPSYTRADAVAQVATMVAKGFPAYITAERWVDDHAEWDIALPARGVQ